ncbi:piggyBac transposable element-derived protein 4-like [Mercenaria mercenaria]|uniref:piggyBac transposable element-derived protein 4-like n=1 Tax=Mercenaria mercenaria TaxID=6596 RepID=UPI00234F8829|nr:piggyBac transposable element-derived protein 4-like [Mercenaria mercenaria]
MSRNRYHLLNTFLHFNDNDQRVARGQEGCDPPFKVRPLLDMIDVRYTDAYAPDKELSIDESMIKFKGRIFFRQYMPAKPTKWGIKTFALCGSNTGYGLRFLIHTGKNTFSADRSSEQELKVQGIGACGTVKPNRKFMPFAMQPSALALDEGDDPEFVRTQDLITCAMVDTKRVHFLSSVHSDNTFDKVVRDRKAAGGRRTVVRPVMCDAYNSHMNGVDVLDQKLGSYSYPHKSAKWYMTVFHRLREVALVNWYIIYCKSVQEGGTPMTTVTFREKVIDGLLEGWDLCASKKGRPSLTEKPDRLTGRHFPGQYTDPK